MHTIQKKTDINVNRNVKILISLILAAFSITLSGITLSSLRNISSFSILDTFIKFGMTITLVGIIYSFNDIIDNTDQKKMKRDYSRPIIWLFLLFLDFLFMWFNHIEFIHSLIICFVILFIGIIYSIEYTYHSKLFKIKNMFIIKNIFIALGWALLIPLGHNASPDFYIAVFTVFTFIQVFIGSIIRDLSDIAEDKKFEVNSIPVRLGEKRTIRLLFFINSLSIVFIIISSFIIRDYQLSISLLLLPSLFRVFLIYKIKFDKGNSLYLQTFNLATCWVIFLSQAILI